MLRAVCTIDPPPSVLLLLPVCPFNNTTTSKINNQLIAGTNNSPAISLMASSSPSPFTTTIELDRPIYNPGDALTGQVLLDLERPLACDRIVVKLHGSARVFFTELNKKTGASFGKSRAFEQEKVLLDQQTEVWRAEGGAEEQKKKKDGKSLEEIVRLSNPNTIRMNWQHRKVHQKGSSSPSTGLPIGRHQFHFAFKLPLEGLFTSFDARNSAGSVRFHVLVQAFHDGFNCLRQKLLFPIVCPRRLDEPRLREKALRPVLEEGSDKKDLLRVQLSLDKQGYVPGEPLCGTVRIDNRSPKSVKRMNLRIVQRTICFATRPEFRTHESQFETPGMGLPVPKVRSGEQLSFPIRFFVPALVPEMSVPGCIESDHSLQLTVSTKGGTLAVELSTPLLIGTHPTSMAAHRPLSQQQQSAAAPEKVAPPPFGAPPLYEECQQTETAVQQEEDVPPPSYALSVAGLSSVDENGMREQYAPVCYHYNFGFNGEADEEEAQKK